MAVLPKRIIFLTGTGQYEAMDLFITDLGQAFSALGYEIYVLDLTEKNAYLMMAQLMSEGNIKFFFSMNGIGYDLRLQGQSIFDLMGVPLVSWFIDHPIYHQNRLSADIQHWILLFSNEHLVDFYREHYPMSKRVIGELTFGARCHLEALRPIPERPMEVVFFGSYYGNLQDFEQKLTSSDVRINQAIWETVQQGLYESSMELSDIFRVQLEQAGIEPADWAHVEYTQTLIAIDRYIRLWRRHHLIASLKEVPIYIYGQGWDQSQLNRSNLHFMGAVDFRQALRLMDQAKLSLNIMPNIRAGVHDRMIYGMANGVASLSDSHPWLEQRFVHGESVYYYSLRQSLQEKALDQQILDILSYPEHIQRVATQGKQLAEAGFSWERKAHEVLAVAEAHQHQGAVK